MLKKKDSSGIIISPKGRHRGGVKLPHRKYSAKSETEILPTPKKVTLLMQQHIGAPCNPIVKKGDTVGIGQVVAEPTSFVGSPVHATVSGTVSALSRVLTPSGNFCDAIEIESDGENRLYEKIAPPKVDSKDELIEAVKNLGLVGLGGAGFPTFIKLNPKEEVDTLIINAAECEPYITADNRLILENTEDVIDGIELLVKHIGFKKTVIVIEDNKPDAIVALAKIVEERKISDIHIMPVKSSYPKGAEKIMVLLATGKVVMEGSLPSEVGCVVLNVTTVATIGDYVKTGVPLVNRRITVSGEGVKEPKNLIVPIGTEINEILEYCKITRNERQKIILGGPMMGSSLQDDSLPIVKQNNAILVLDEKDSTPAPPSDCIRCGRCVSACPMALSPTKIERDLKLHDIELLKADHIMICMECGCCAYSCPAARPLVQSIRQAKALVKKEGK